MVLPLSSSASLRSNSIGPQGAKALADALKINRTLASLWYVSPAPCLSAPRRWPREPSHQVPPMEWEVIQNGDHEILAPTQWMPGDLVS